MQVLDKREIPMLIERLKTLGYSIRKRVRIYGEELELTSDPFPRENSFMVEGKSRRSGESKRLKIPLSLLQIVKNRGRSKAA